MIDLERLLDSRPSRRALLAGGLKGLAGGVLLTGLPRPNGVVLAASGYTPTPGVTEGPYWVDELLNRSDLRTDPTTGTIQYGFPLYLGINVMLLLNNRQTLRPLPGALVDIWHCNALGVYSDEAVESTSGQKFLRGFQVTNTQGNVVFQTIYPGWYSGRTTHVHVRVRVFNGYTSTVIYNYTTQFFFNDAVTNLIYKIAPYTQHANRDTTNSADTVYTGGSFDGSVTANAGQQLLLRLSAGSGYLIGTFNVFIDVTDTKNEG
jgi:protocatechuate 3,4-dioxygenase beta subunit